MFNIFVLFSQARLFKIIIMNAIKAVQFQKEKDPKRLFGHSLLHARSHSINRNHIICTPNVNTFWLINN